MHIPNHLIQRNPCGNHTLESHLCPKTSIANDKTQSSVLKYQSIARDKNSIVSVIPPTINDFLASLVTKESIEMNELPVIGSLCLRDDLSRERIRILVFAQTFLGSPRGKHYNSPESRLFGRRNNPSPYIASQQVATFVAWRSQKSWRKHKNPITGNSSIQVFPVLLRIGEKVDVKNFHRC